MIPLADDQWERFLAFVESKLQGLKPIATVELREIRQACYADSDVSGESLCEALEAKRKAKGVVHIDFSFDSSNQKFTFERMPSFPHA